MMTAYKIKFTDDRCAIAGESTPGIPTVLGPDGIVEQLSDYLRYLAHDKVVSPTTLQTYSKTLREFWANLREDRRKWDRVNDSYLKRWRDRMLRTKGLKKRTINHKLRTIFGFYVWAEETKRLSSVVDLSGKRFSQLPISVVLSSEGLRSCPLIYRTSEEPNRHTPTDEEVDQLHVVLSGRHAVRDGLIMTWAEQTALRREEILFIHLNQIPSLDEIHELYNREQTHSILVKVKGGRECQVEILPYLLEQTLDYITYERSDTLAYARKHQLHLRDCGGLFLSERGSVLEPNSVSRQTAKFFRRAGIRNASLHRLRAVHLTRIAERYVDMVDDQGVPLSTQTIALKIQGAARWVGTSSLPRYIDEARSRRVNAGKEPRATRPRY